MNKSTHFAGQPTFIQLLKLIPKDIISNCVAEAKSDHYYKKFNTWHHLVTMLFSCYGNCTSLREVITGIRALEGRLHSGGIRHLPARSTFSQANADRDCKVFERIYFSIKAYWDKLLPDSRPASDPIYIIDSTVITLFQEIFKGTGTSFADGRRKGGLKVHMAVPLYEHSPCIVHISDGSSNDSTFTKNLVLPAESTVIMDRGYRDYRQYNLWTSQKIRWVTRPREKMYYELISQQPVSPQNQQEGVEGDLHVILGYPQPKTPPVKARIIEYTDKKTGKHLSFLTNDFTSDPSMVAQLYQKRWSIELLFKRLKQNMPLQYFLGDNKNAIQIQIWCALIADLLLNVIRKQIKRKWAFSNLVSLVRLHLFNYLNLYSFLENPERCKILSQAPINPQIRLSLYGRPPI